MPAYIGKYPSSNLVFIRVRAKGPAKRYYGNNLMAAYRSRIKFSRQTVWVISVSHKKDLGIKQLWTDA